jgi:hypothetical protein
MFCLFLSLCKSAFAGEEIESLAVFLSNVLCARYGKVLLRSVIVKTKGMSEKEK